MIPQRPSLDDCIGTNYALSRASKAKESLTYIQRTPSYEKPSKQERLSLTHTQVLHPQRKMLSMTKRSLWLLVVVLALVATSRTNAQQSATAGSSDGTTPVGSPSPSPSSTPSPSPKVTPSPSPRTTPTPTTEAPVDEESSASGSEAGATTAPPTETPAPTAASSSAAGSTKSDVVATVKTTSAVTRTTVTAITAAPDADNEADTTNVLDTDSVNSNYGTKSPSPTESVSTSSDSGSSSTGWLVPAVIAAVVVSALVVVTVFVRKNKQDDDDDDDVDDFDRRTNNFFQHPRSNTNQGMVPMAPPAVVAEPEPPLFKPKPEPSTVQFNPVSMQPMNRGPRVFSIPMLQSPHSTASGESIDGRDTGSGAESNFRVTSPNSMKYEDDRESAISVFEGSSVSGVTL